MDQKTPTTAQPVTTAGGGSKAPAIVALVLGVISLITVGVFFVSLPLAIIAVILAIIALVKRRPGKGLAIAGLITGGIAVLLFPIVLMITMAAYQGISERAQEAAQEAQQRAAQ